MFGRHSPEVPSRRDILRGQIVIETEIGTLRLQTAIAPSAIDDWDRAIDAPAEAEPVSRLGHRCPEIEIGSGGGSGIWEVTVSDPAQSGGIVQIPITIDVEDSRERLAAVRQAFPREAVQSTD